jgi:hypothetical protein
MPRADAASAVLPAKRTGGSEAISQGCGESALLRLSGVRCGSEAPRAGELTVCLSNVAVKKPRVAAPCAGKAARSAPPRGRATRASAARFAAVAHNATLQLLRLDDGPLARVLAELQVPPRALGAPRALLAKSQSA